MLKVNDLQMHFPVYGGLLRRQVAKVFAVDKVDLSVAPGETLGLVGESGCGKSTLGRAILQLYKPTAGSVKFQDKELTQLSKSEMREVRKDIQIILQDPGESLNSRHTVGRIIEEPLIIHKIGKNAAERKKQVLELLQKVGLQEDSYHRYPHEFSGGQRQRISIARAIALKPKLIICDEAVSALDVSIQSQILNLLMDLQKEMNLAYIFISHDLSVVRHVSDRIAVMYLGKIVELTDTDALYNKSLHPYTQALISAIPQPDPRRKKTSITLQGDVPSPLNPPSGCHFHTRCPLATDLCKTQVPELKQYSTSEKSHQASCHLISEP
ncbi:dipeptide ABC transporter ATP-binding protein [Lentisphaera profundi]|uniref:Dipeptide ABC transporter ATP-binding protein n=2 Tax=Lentisphaera profundi TaxID=1658616 RepID=A0ABY7VS68_9BACT|nr:dipeptide ABC transporter ATP-binding protein [Lentisphaera profundi]WDE95696.1 dipeptide ABC transporter ATP-binding protein [Lentisphaera profundi]